MPSLIDLRRRIRAAWLMCLKAAWLADRGEPNMVLFDVQPDLFKSVPECGIGPGIRLAQDDALA